MKIDRKLNLVQPIETESGTIYVHSTPISVEVWRSYFLILAKTYSQIFAQGLHAVYPTVAVLMLERMARADDVWSGDTGVERGLLPEIRRLSNVIMPSGAGWETVPYEQALARQLLSQEDIEEIEGAIIFFICASAVLRGTKSRKKLEILLGMMESQWGASISSLDATAFAASLQTSTPVDNTGVKPLVLSVPH